MPGEADPDRVTPAMRQRIGYLGWDRGSTVVAGGMRSEVDHGVQDDRCPVGGDELVIPGSDASPLVVHGAECGVVDRSEYRGVLGVRLGRRVLE
jgi:hypothetical protein